VESVSWQDIQGFIMKLSLLTGRTYRLPTEAEWEYAARGGGASRGYRYAGGDGLEGVAWHAGNSGKRTRPVGGKDPNELGLYDMSGNVAEWCQDWFGVYPLSEQTDPNGPHEGLRRVTRGGAWNNYPRFCRVLGRGYNTPESRYSHLGFRLVISL